MIDIGGAEGRALWRGRAAKPLGCIAYSFYSIGSKVPVARLRVVPHFAEMRIIKSAPAMQRLGLQWQTLRLAVALVPTMGYLHEGHLSLVRRARRAVGPRGLVVVSIYVNPTQFAPHEDLARYPRDLGRDLRLCRGEGTDFVFAPSDAEMYVRDRESPFSTYVVEEDVSRLMEGASRPGHFRGVATVVSKLFNLVRPTVAVFGSKDFQQAAMISRMTRDLNFPVRLLLVPTVREPDGLALSSRNSYLTREERAQATVLWRALQQGRREVRALGTLAAAELKRKLTKVIQSAPLARLDYLELFEPKTLKPVAQARRGTQMALAVYVGKIRLIDNARL